MVRMVVPWRLVDRGSPALSGRDWIAKPADNICGLRDPNQLSSPALVDFRVCLDATPEVRRMREQNIDPASPKGIQLHSEAVNRVTAACEAVRMANGHCSVWKEIRHKDGRVVANITELVKAQF